jgi:hypothetical protein
VGIFGSLTAGDAGEAPPSLLKRQEGTGTGNCTWASSNGKGSEGEKPCVRRWYETGPPRFVRRKPLRTSKRREGKELGEATPGKHEALRRTVHPGSRADVAERDPKLRRGRVSFSTQDLLVGSRDERGSQVYARPLKAG